MLNTRRFWSRNWRDPESGRRWYGHVVLPVLQRPDERPEETDVCDRFHETLFRNGREDGGWLHRVRRPVCGAGRPAPPALVAAVGYRGVMRTSEILTDEHMDERPGARLHTPKLMPGRAEYRKAMCVRTFWFHTHWTPEQRAELQRVFDACRWIHNAVYNVWRGTGIHHSASGVYASWLSTRGSDPVWDPIECRMVPAEVPRVRERRQGRRRGARGRPGRRGKGRRGGRNRPHRRRRPRLPAPWRPGCTGAPRRGPLEQQLGALYDRRRALRATQPPDRDALKAVQERIDALNTGPALRSERLALMRRFPRPPAWIQTINAHIRKEAVDHALVDIARVDQKARRNAWGAARQRERWDALTPEQQRGRRPPRGPRTYRIHQQQRDARFTPTEVVYLQKAQPNDTGPVQRFDEWPGDDRPPGRNHRSAAMFMGNNFAKLGGIRIRGPRALVDRLLTKWEPPPRKRPAPMPAATNTDEAPETTTGSSRPPAAKRRRNNTGAAVTVVPDTEEGGPDTTTGKTPGPQHARLRYAAILHWDKRRRAVRLGVQFEDPVAVSHTDAMRAPEVPDRVVGLDPGVRVFQTFCATDGTHGDLMTDLRSGRAGDPARVAALRGALRDARLALTADDRALDAALRVARDARRSATRPGSDGPGDRRPSVPAGNARAGPDARPAPEIDAAVRPVRPIRVGRCVASRNCAGRAGPVGERSA